MSGAGAGRQPSQPIHRPELLAPAGDWECAKAAVENGADAIYFGLDRFNARMRARNFTEADLPRLMEFLHRRGVRGYVSFNTLVFANELADAERFLRTCLAAGVDAVIVQDVGICRLIRRLSPDFPIHASTQMTITSAAGVAFARELGCNLVVLARECSLKDIERIQAEQRAADAADLSLAPCPSPLPLEVFVHGALCVAYSGQCLTSEALGGRSANRGECAQACRLPYDLIADGRPVPLGARRYLLSPQDLAGVGLLPHLLRLGVASLKIEGRLKSPEYVANITRIYREALDAAGQAWTGEHRMPEARHRMREAGGRRAETPGRDPKYEMEMAFSRGLYTGWFGGTNNQALVHARFPKKRGVYLGEVSRVQGDRVFVRLEGPLKPGDGVVFDAGRPDEKEEGGRVYEVRREKLGVRRQKLEGRDGAGEVRGPVPGAGEPAEASRPIEVPLTFGRGDIDFRRVHVGDKLWKTSDPELDRRLRQTFAGDQPRFQRPVEIEVHGRAGEPLTVIARDESGHVTQAVSAMPLAAATNQPLTPARLAEQLGRLGGTPFTLGRLASHLEDAVMLPLSELNRLRRELVADLEAQREKPKRWLLRTERTTLSGRRMPDAGSPMPVDGWEGGGAALELIVLVRSLPQLEAALAAGVATIYCELEDPKQYRAAVAIHRQKRAGVMTSRSSAPRPSSLLVAPPRIAKPGEEWILKQVRSSDADGYLIRNYDHLRFFAGCRCVGDFSLNVANALAAEYFIDRFGLERVTASYDLNAEQLEALLGAAPPAWFEITIHQHMPMFHMEHCVFCAFLTSGKDYRDCGRPCDRVDLRLRDRVGAQHPVKADAGCRNTVFNALAQTGAEYVQRLIALGARRFRIEFLDEPPETVARTIGCYQQLLRGEISGSQLWRELKLRHQLGVTRGSLDKGERPITVL